MSSKPREPAWEWVGVARHLLGRHNLSGRNGLGRWEASDEISITDSIGGIPVVGEWAQGALDAWLPISITSSVITRGYDTDFAGAVASLSFGAGFEVRKFANAQVGIGVATGDNVRELFLDVNTTATLSFEKLTRDVLARGLNTARAQGSDGRDLAQLLRSHGVLDQLKQIFPQFDFSGHLGFCVGIADGVGYVRFSTMFGASLTLNLPGVLNNLGIRNPSGQRTTGGRSWQLQIRNFKGHLPYKFGL